MWLQALGGAITISDGVKQQWTGSTAAEAVAGISRDTSSTAEFRSAGDKK